MNNMYKYIILLSLLITNDSCNHNRLRTSETDLRNEILSQEKSEAGKNGDASYHPDTLNRPTKGSLYMQDRSGDPVNPPVVIDIAGNLNNTAEIRLSDVASEVKYVRLDPVPDPEIPRDLKFKYHLTDNYIVAINLYGIHLYSKDGRYIRPVVRNELTGVTIKPDNIFFYFDYTLKGGEMSVRSKGDNIFYTYSNTMTGEKYIMKFDASSAPLTEAYRFDPENPERISGLGEVVLDLNHGMTVPPTPKSHQGGFGGDPEWVNFDRNIFMLDNNSYAIPSGKEKIMTIRNVYGDTLTSFTRFEKLVNYSKSVMRGTDDGVQYENSGMLYIRPEYNDTVFQVMPPNRFVPRYVLNLGTFKVTMQQGADPDFDLTGKIIPEAWAETHNFIFLTYTRDSYDCPANRKSKKVKIYHALYSKKEGRLDIITGDPFNYTPEILENNIDGGVPVWPSSYMISNDGEIMVSLKGKDLKERVKSEEYKLSKAPSDKKQNLQRLAETVTDSQDILMIIK